MFGALLLPEFDQEMKSTRKLLECVPEHRWDWKPHEKSMSLGRLAGHVAELPGWATTTIERESLDLTPPRAAATAAHGRPFAYRTPRDLR